MVNESVDEEDIILICFDPNNELVDFKKRFNQINVDVIFHTEFQSCITFIQSIDKQTVFLITPPSQILSHSSNLQQIHSIFMFRFNHNQYEYSFLANPKVIGIYDNINSLCSSIQEQICFIGKQIPRWCFFDQKEYTTRDLSKQSSHFLWLQLLHDVLLCLPHDKQAKKQMFETCRYYYQDYPEELLLIDEFEQKYQSKEALRWFIKHPFLQNMINKALQMEHTVLLYTLRYFLADLLENLTHKHQQNVQYERDNIIVYREMKLLADEFNQLQENKGRLISMKEFLIANTDRSLSLSSKERTEFISVIFEIECNIKELGDSLIFTDITQFNESSSSQNTMLFDFNTTFQLVNIQQNEQIWIIKLIAVNDGRSILQKYIYDTHRQIENLSTPIMFGQLLCNMSEWNQSQEYLERLMKDSPDEDVAWIEYCIGQAYYWQGKWRKSQQYYDRAYSRMMKTKPLRIKDSALVLSNIGDIFCHRGKYEKASDFHQRAFTIRKKYYDSKHAYIASSLVCIGMDYFRQRKHDEASAFLKQALAIQEEYYNCSHIDIAGNLTGIGSVLNNQRKYDEALEYYEQAVSIYENYYPSGHVLIASTLNSIGYVLSRKKKYNEAIAIVERALTMQKFFYPYGHIDIASSLYNMGHIKYGQRKYDESLELYQQVLIIQRKYFFLGHLDIVRTLNSLGFVQRHRKGNYDEALHYHQQALTMLKTDYPSYTARIAMTLERIGNVSRKQMKNDEALDLYHQALKMWEKFYLCDHFDMISVLSNIGNILNDQEKYYEALKYYQRTLAINEKHYPPYHMNIVINLKTIGNFKQKQGQFDDAFDYYQRALVILEEYHPMNYTEIIIYCLSVIAQILGQKSVYSRAIEYLERGLRMSEASCPQGHSSIVHILWSLGILQNIGRQYELSLTYELQCFSIREKVLPPDHQDIGESLSNIGTCYEQLNQIKTALEYHKRALVIYEQCLPFEHVDRKNVQLKIAQLSNKVEQINI